MRTRYPCRRAWVSSILTLIVHKSGQPPLQKLLHDTMPITPPSPPGGSFFSFKQWLAGFEACLRFALQLQPKTGNHAQILRSNLKPVAILYLRRSNLALRQADPCHTSDFILQSSRERRHAQGSLHNQNGQVECSSLRRLISGLCSNQSTCRYV